MINGVKKSPKAFFAKLAKFTGLTGCYQRLAPRMRLGNQPDMPTITTDKLWFLRENRFLFLTRDGPIEVTLKPSFVLTGILVGMAGIATIFYSTLIASYSAIEVMRDETIQTAEASISTKPIDLAPTNIMNWKQYQPSNSIEQLSPEIKRQHAQPSGTITKPTDNEQDGFLSSTSPYERTVDDYASEYLPMIIQGGKRVTLTDEEKTEISDQVSNMRASRELAEGAGRAPFSSGNTKAPKTVVAKTNANPDLSDQKNTKKHSIFDVIKPETKTTLGTKISADTTPLDSQAVAQKSKKNKIKTSQLANRAREYAVALLPSFIAKPNSIKQDNEPENTNGSQQNLQTERPPNLATTASVPRVIADDGLLTNKNDTKNGPILPVVNEAVRIKKMLLAHKQEIDYIRKTIIGLGISQDELPVAPPSNNQIDEQSGDEDFRNLMVTLAEHRAALRKIPFKPPMLYFYVSSGYGMRKHPKTNKKTFHHGIDLAGTWQENVRTTAPGKVVYAGSEGAFGKVVRVQHGFGVVTVYAHLARITVKLGDYVSEGHVVGKMGNTGRSAGAHLHYEIRINGKSIDPDKFMKVGRQLSVAGELRQSALTR